MDGYKQQFDSENDIIRWGCDFIYYLNRKKFGLISKMIHSNRIGKTLPNYSIDNALNTGNIIRPPLFTFTNKIDEDLPYITYRKQLCFPIMSFPSRASLLDNRNDSF